MRVRESVDLGNGHLIEIGAATWDENTTSVRNRYPTSTGGFNPRSSSEIPLDDIEYLVVAVGERDLLDVPTCARIISILSASVARSA